MSSAMWGFIINDDSVGDVPVIEGKPDKAAVFARFDPGSTRSAGGSAVCSGRLGGLNVLAGD